MKTRKRLFFILSALVVCVVLSATVLQWAISSKINNILTEQLNHAKQETDYIFESHNNRIQSYVNENSFWDEFYNSVGRNDTNWMKENMTNSLVETNYGEDFIWVLNNKNKTIYAASLDTTFSTSLLSTTPISFFDTLKKNNFQHCCIQLADKTIELYSAPIQPSIDVKRISTPRGFLILGRQIDHSYLAELSKTNNEIKYSLTDLKTKPTDKISRQSASIVYYKSLASFDKKEVVVQATVYQPVIAAYEKFVWIGFVLFVFILLVCLAGFLILFSKSVLNPLKLISKALHKKSPIILSRLMLQKNEFGEIARLIRSSFNHHLLLEEEIANRKASEAALKKADGVKNDFLSTMSHEIRTPINGVIGVTNLLLDESLTAKQMEYVKILNHSSNQLLSVFSDILDFSKLENENFKFEKTQFSLFATCSSVFQLFKSKADEKNLQFTFHPDSKINGLLIGDEARLNQVLNNLFSNAIKFTNVGSVDFSYQLISNTPNGSTIEFKIEDTGIGIKPDELSKVFDSFSQANTSINRKYGGTGLGLTICKKLIEKQNGKIFAHSTYKEGTTFTFYLTFENSVAMPASANFNLPQKQLLGMKILIAEDNNINVLVLKQFLIKWGAEVIVAENGLQALDRVEHEHFDLVLMDLHMPEMNGLEATSHIRHSADANLRKLPVIALTADASINTQQLLLQNGFDHYITKPFFPDSLYKLLFQYKHAS